MAKTRQGAISRGSDNSSDDANNKNNSNIGGGGTTRRRVFSRLGLSLAAVGAVALFRTIVVAPPTLPADAVTANAKNQTTSKQTRLPPPILIPDEMYLFRQGIPQPDLYPLTADAPALNGECSCRNPKSTGDCCERVAVRSHKFGHVLMGQLLNRARTGKLVAKRESSHLSYNMSISEQILPDPANSKDFRVVLFMRNIYKALVSGYNYHNPKGRMGQECQYKYGVEVWVDVLSYRPDPPTSMFNNRLCTYMKKNPPEVAMRAYLGTLYCTVSDSCISAPCTFAQLYCMLVPNLGSNLSHSLLYLLLYICILARSERFRYAFVLQAHVPIMDCGAGERRRGRKDNGRLFRGPYQPQRDARERYGDQTSRFSVQRYRTQPVQRYRGGGRTRELARSRAHR